MTVDTGMISGGEQQFTDDFDGRVVHPIQPYQARKSYGCPGCESVIDVGVGHVVVVPQDAPDMRRHWHRGCWYKERRRFGGVGSSDSA